MFGDVSFHNYDVINVIMVHAFDFPHQDREWARVCLEAPLPNIREIVLVGEPEKKIQIVYQTLEISRFLRVF